MSLLQQRMHEVDAALAHHDWLVESPGLNHPFFQRYLGMPGLVTELLSLLLDKERELAAWDAATLHHAVKHWERDPKHIRVLLSGATRGIGKSLHMAST